MWARVVEIMLGFWLVISPFVFQRATGPVSPFGNDLFCGLAAMIFGLFSFWKRSGWAHFLTLIIALWLIGYGYFAGLPSPPTAQNRIITGLLLAMFAIIPNRAEEIPAGWQAFYDR